MIKKIKSNMEEEIKTILKETLTRNSNERTIISKVQSKSPKRKNVELKTLEIVSSLST